MRNNQTTPFQDNVYRLARKVTKGRVTTYAAIAHALGHAGYRSIGQALTRNPDIPITPCHRVVNSDGRIGGYAFNVHKKIALLEAEGVHVKDGRVVNFERIVIREL
jgi:methylated-DNA-[protein]-cysteine S-methyltransferase